MGAVAEGSSREKILDVAEALFARRGYAGVGLQEVADAAGLRKSSLFHHFRSKTQLYVTVLGRVLARLRERLDPVFASREAPRQRLVRLIDALVDGLAEQPTSARLLLRGLVEDEAYPEEPSPEADAAEATLQAILAGIHRALRAGVASGELRAASVPDAVQTLVGATVYHFASGELGESVLGEPLLSAAAVRRRKLELERLLLHGLASPASP